jgi:hypothetical protein
MIPKSGRRFSDKIMVNQEKAGHDPKEWEPVSGKIHGRDGK